MPTNSKIIIYENRIFDSIILPSRCFFILSSIVILIFFLEILFSCNNTHQNDVTFPCSSKLPLRITFSLYWVEIVCTVNWSRYSFWPLKKYTTFKRYIYDIPYAILNKYYAPEELHSMQINSRNKKRQKKMKKFGEILSLNTDENNIAITIFENIEI